VLPNSNRITIVGGCGHVGLPLGIVLAKHGFSVTLLDIDAEKINMVNAGQMPFMEQGAAPLLSEVRQKNLIATLDRECLRSSDIVITVIGTPVDRHLNPTVHELYRSIDGLMEFMRDGSLLILRSTVSPGVTKLVYQRVQAMGRAIDVAFCPERIAEGNAIEELVKLPQIVAAFEPRALQRAREVFEAIAPVIIELDPLEAELAKLFTNSWRYLNFAVSNQFYMLATACGLDFYRIHNAVTQDYPRMRNFATAGFAAGPCLVKDTLQLAAFSGNNFFLGHSAMLINEGLPNFIVNQLGVEDLSSKTVAILGMAFKAESDDKRDSLSYKLKKLLEVRAKRVLCTDPYVPDPNLVPLHQALAEADIIILGAPHKQYKDLKFSPDQVVVDIWNAWPALRETSMLEAITEKIG
jgi:UDP-N-acetyl-D-mannosaminuronic acid dehydrogenase